MTVPNKIPARFLTQATLTDVAVAFQYQRAPESPDGVVFQDFLREQGVNKLAGSTSYKDEVQFPETTVTGLGYRWILWDAITSLWHIEQNQAFSTLDMVGIWTPIERHQIGLLHAFCQTGDRKLYYGPGPQNTALFYAWSIMQTSNPIWPASHVSEFGRRSATDNQRVRLLVMLCRKKLLGTEFPFAGNW